MIRKKFITMRGGILFIAGGEMAIDIHGEHVYGEQDFASEEQFQKQVDSGLIYPIEEMV